MSLYKYSILFALLMWPIWAQGQIPESYLQEAAENNPAVRARYAEFEAAMQRAAQANYLQEPTLSIGYFIAPVETRVGPQRARFSLSQMFPWFGTLAARHDAAALMAEAKYQEFINAQNKLFYDVKSAWYPLYEIEQKLQLQRENKEILRIYKNLSITAFSNNKGSMADAMRTDIMLTDIETEIEILEALKHPLLVQFNNLLNRPDTTDVIVPDTLMLLSIPPEYRRDSLWANNPVLKSYDLQIQSAAVQEKLARKEGMPRLGIGVDYVVVDKRDDVVMPDNGSDVLMPMVSLSLPIFRGKYRAGVKEAIYKQEALEASREDYRNDLVSSYENTIYQLYKAAQMVKLYEAQIVKTKQITELLLKTYSNSGKDFEEVLRAQQQQLKYEIGRAGAIKDFYIALAKLDYLTAKPE